MGLALGALLVYGLVQLGIAAGGILLLLFFAILLASALEPPIDRSHRPEHPPPICDAGARLRGPHASES